jgi:hypothetical protein
VNGPNAAGAPSESDSVAPTEPPTGPVVLEASYAAEALLAL